MVGTATVPYVLAEDVLALNQHLINPPFSVGRALRLTHPLFTPSLTLAHDH
jgi:hypothetical protein